MAIEKDIAVHKTRGVQKCIEYVDDEDKCSLGETQSLDVLSLLNYSQNEDKTTTDTDEVILSSGVMCNPRYAALQFQKTADSYRKRIPEGTGLGSGGTKLSRDHNDKEKVRVAKESVEAYHVIQSFPDTAGLDPKLVHKIGLEYARAAFPKYQCVVSTHMNTGHLHNHIVVCAYEMGGGRKLPMNMKYRNHIRHINDELSIKYGLPNLHNHIVVCAYKADGSRKLPMNKKFRYNIRKINDELSLKYNLSILLGNEHRFEKKMGLGEDFAALAGVSFKEQIRLDIEQTLSKDYVSSWADYVIYLKTLGYEIKETAKNVTYTRPYIDKDGKRRAHKCREIRLGDAYLRSSICERKQWEIQAPSHESSYLRHLRQIYNESQSSHDRLWEDDRGRNYLVVDRYDDDGRRRSGLELLIVAAVKMVEYYWDRFTDISDKMPQSEIDPIDMPPYDKIISLLEGFEIARTLNIDTKDDLKVKKREIGRNLAKCRRDLSSCEAESIKLGKELDSLNESRIDSTAAADLTARFHELSEKYVEIRNHVASLSNTYRLLSRLDHSTDLAISPKFCMGRGADMSDYPYQGINEERRDLTRGRKSEKNLDVSERDLEMSIDRGYDISHRGL